MSFKRNKYEMTPLIIKGLFFMEVWGNTPQYSQILPIFPPPPQITPTTFEIKKSEQGNRGYIGHRFQLSLSTIWRNHLPFNQ